MCLSTTLPRPRRPSFPLLFYLLRVPFSLRWFRWSFSPRSFLSVSRFYFLFQFFISSSSLHPSIFPLSASLFRSARSPFPFIVSSHPHALLSVSLSFSLFLPRSYHLCGWAYNENVFPSRKTHILITNSPSRGLLPWRVVTPNPIFRPNGDSRRTRWFLRTRVSHKMLARSVVRITRRSRGWRVNSSRESTRFQCDENFRRRRQTTCVEPGELR